MDTWIRIWGELKGFCDNFIVIILKKKEPAETLPVRDSYCFFPVCIHHIRNARDLCSLLGQAHYVFPWNSRQVKAPAASHQLLQSGPGLLAVTIDTQGPQRYVLHITAEPVQQFLIMDKYRFDPAPLQYTGSPIMKVEIQPQDHLEIDGIKI